MLLQLLPAVHFSIWFNHFFINEDTWIGTKTATPLVTMHFMLTGTVKGNAPHFSGDGLDAGTYQLFYIPPGEHYRIQFAKGSYHAIRIDMEASFLEQMAAFFPQVSVLIDALGQNSRTGIRFPEGHITFRTKTILEELATTDTSRPGKDLFLHARVYELLWLYLSELVNTGEKSPVQMYFKKVQQVREFILLNLDKEIGTTFLARHFAISATTLKRQFKHQYGLTIREFLVQQRMHTAMELLTHTNLSIHSIGAKVGYPEFSSFTRAFTRFFEHSPMHFRKA